MYWVSSELLVGAPQYISCTSLQHISSRPRSPTASAPRAGVDVHRWPTGLHCRPRNVGTCGCVGGKSGACYAFLFGPFWTNVGVTWIAKAVNIAGIHRVSGVCDISQSNRLTGVLHLVDVHSVDDKCEYSLDIPGKSADLLIFSCTSSYVFLIMFSLLN